MKKITIALTSILLLAGHSHAATNPPTNYNKLIAILNPNTGRPDYIVNTASVSLADLFSVSTRTVTGAQASDGQVLTFNQWLTSGTWMPRTPSASGGGGSGDNFGSHIATKPVIANYGLSSTGTIMGAIRDYGGQVYNVKAFGALGNNAMNDSVAIQMAIDSAATNSPSGGIVLLPPGYFRANIVMRSNVRLVGSGIDVTTITRASAGDVIISTGFFGLTGTGSIGGIHEFSIENMTISGDFDNDAIARTTLNGALNGSDTTINVADASAFASSGTFVITTAGGYSEAIAYTGNTGISFTGCTRSTDVTVATVHSNGDTVFQRYTYPGIAGDYGYGIRIYGFDYKIRNVAIKRTRQDGFYSEWAPVGVGGALSPHSMEAAIENLKVHHCQGNGITWRGPHDTKFHDVLTWSNNLSGIVLLSNGAAENFVNSHSYGLQIYSWYMGTGGQCANCIGEQAVQGQFRIAQNETLLTNAWAFGTGGQPVKGFIVGDSSHSVSDIRIDGYCRNCEAGAVDFSGDGGANSISITINQAAGVAFVSSASINTNLNIINANAGSAVNGNVFQFGGTRKLAIDSFGNVAFGTTTPVSPLHILSSLNPIGNPNSAINYSLYLQKNAFANGGSVGIAFGDAAAPTVQASIMSTRQSAGVGSLEFYTAGVGSVPLERMRLTQGGSMVIGATVPVTKLDVAGDIVARSSVNAYGGFATTGTIQVLSSLLDPVANPNTGANYALYLNKASFTNGTAIGIGFGDAAVPTVQASIMSSRLGAGVGSLEFYTANTGSAPQERVRIDRGGYVGFGTTVPVARVDIAGGWRASSGSIVGTGGLTISSGGTVAVGTFTVTPNVGVLIASESATNNSDYSFLRLSTGAEVSNYDFKPTSLTVNVAAVAATAETIARFGIADMSSSFLSINNKYTTNSNFSPQITGVYNGSAFESLSFLADSVVGGSDAGSLPMMTFNSRVAGNTALVTRPIYQWQNNGVTRMLMSANGNLFISNGVNSSSGVYKSSVTAFGGFYTTATVMIGGVDLTVYMATVSQAIAAGGTGGGSGSGAYYDGTQTVSVTTWTIPFVVPSFTGSFATVPVFAATPTFTGSPTFNSSVTFRTPITSFTATGFNGQSATMTLIFGDTVTARNLNMNRIVFSSNSGRLTDYPVAYIDWNYGGPGSGSASRFTTTTILLTDMHIEKARTQMGLRPMIRALLTLAPTTQWGPLDAGAAIQLRTQIQETNLFPINNLEAGDIFVTNNATQPIVGMFGATSWVQNGTISGISGAPFGGFGGSSITVLSGHGFIAASVSSASVDLLAPITVFANDAGELIQNGRINKFHGIHVGGMDVTAIATVTERALLFLSSAPGGEAIVANGGADWAILSLSTATSSFYGAIAIGNPGKAPGANISLANSNDTNVTIIQPSTSTTGTILWVLPDSAGTPGQFLQVNPGGGGKTRLKVANPGDGGIYIPAPYSLQIGTAMVVSSGTGWFGLGLGTSAPTVPVHIVVTDTVGVVSSLNKGANMIAAVGAFVYNETKPGTLGSVPGVNNGWEFIFFSSVTTGGSPFIVDSALNAIVTVDGGAVTYNANSSVTGGNYIGRYQGTGTMPRATAALFTGDRSGVGSMTFLEGARFQNTDSGGGGTVGNTRSIIHIRPTSVAGSIWSNTCAICIDTANPTAGTLTNPAYGIYAPASVNLNWIAGRVSLGSDTANGTSLLDVGGGSITVRDTGRGIGGGISASSYTVKGFSIFTSTFQPAGGDGSIITFSSGSIAPNTTVTISNTNLLLTSITLPVCGNLRGAAAPALPIYINDTLSATQMQLTNPDLTNAQKFTCMVWGKP